MVVTNDKGSLTPLPDHNDPEPKRSGEPGKLSRYASVAFGGLKRTAQHITERFHRDATSGTEGQSRFKQIREGASRFKSRAVDTILGSKVADAEGRAGGWVGGLFDGIASLTQYRENRRRLKAQAQTPTPVNRADVEPATRQGADKLTQLQLTRLAGVSGSELKQELDKLLLLTNTQLSKYHPTLVAWQTHLVASQTPEQDAQKLLAILSQPDFLEMQEDDQQFFPGQQQ